MPNLGNGVIIDFDTVDGMSKTFGTSAQVLGDVNTALQVIVVALETAAMLGAVGTEAAAMYAANIQPKVQKLAETCQNLSQELAAVISIQRDGDQKARSRFVTA